MLAIASASTSYTLHSVSSYATPLHPRSALVRAHAVASAATATVRLDALLRSGDVESAITLLANDEPLDMTPARTASMIDAACRGPPSAADGSIGFAKLLQTIGEEPEAVLARQRAEEEMGGGDGGGGAGGGVSCLSAVLHRYSNP